MIGSFGDDHTKLLFEKGPKLRFSKEFTKDFTSDKGIIKKAHKKLLYINRANSLKKAEINYTGFRAGIEKER